MIEKEMKVVEQDWLFMIGVRPSQTLSKFTYRPRHRNGRHKSYDSAKPKAT